MNPSKIHTKEFQDSLTDDEKFSIAQIVAETAAKMPNWTYNQTLGHAFLQIEHQRTNLIPPIIALDKRCEAEMTLEDEVSISKFQCELIADHYNQQHQITYYGLDGYIEIPLYWNDEDFKIYVRRGKQYFSCPGCGFETYDENDLNNRLCVDCDQLREFNEQQEIQS